MESSVALGKPLPEEFHSVRVSIVIPAYNEEKRLPRTLTETLSYLNVQEYESEIIVVDDGSRDGTVDLVQRYAEKSPRVRLVKNPGNRGKGFAVRNGVLHARGDYVLFFDADLATSLEDVRPLLAQLVGGHCDVAIGSRHLNESAVQKSQARRLLSWGFSLSQKLLIDIDFKDTQCGFKGFRAEAARAIFSEQKLDARSDAS